MIIFIAPEMRKKRGSGLAQVLTRTPPKEGPSTSGTSSSSSKIPQLTPSKSPAQKKVRVSVSSRSKVAEKLKAAAEPKHFESFCQICLTDVSGSSTLWVQCSGDCQRWHHLKYKDISIQEV